MAAALLLRPYRCRSCRERFYRLYGFAKQWKPRAAPVPVAPAEWPPALTPALKWETGMPQAPKPQGDAVRTGDPAVQVSRDNGGIGTPLCRLVFDRSSEPRR
jgi:hypothetical protein